MGSGCICCLKALLITFNVIFGIIGALFLAVGIFLIVGAARYVQNVLDGAFSSVTGLGSSLSIANFDSSGTLDISKLGDILTPVATVFIVFGVFLLLMCILGGVGLCCKQQCVLYVYAAIVLALFLAQLILVIMFFVGSLDKTIKKQMLASISDEYIKTDSYDIYSMSWNLMHFQLECCGYDGYTDFHDGSKWERTREYTTALGVTVPIVLETPFSCCKTTATEATCASSPTEADNYLNTGCWNQLRDATKSAEKIIIGVISAILILQALCAVGAIVIGLKMKEDEEYV